MSPTIGDLRWKNLAKIISNAVKIYTLNIRLPSAKKYLRLHWQDNGKYFINCDSAGWRKP
ncbi:hypothetical protein [Anabaena sp. CS-542/02]|uniref:hypothetical protein n=1 Tax=Anabaena sp. CS-542/02 TaxID=3021719 RepID=UPI00232EE971|nr:hypothetical protein [Anabaena sp. CS-542/02]MDB9445058.1 hypothetical protein [Anabaena sp. CS-542/02]